MGLGAGQRVGASDFSSAARQDVRVRQPRFPGTGNEVTPGVIDMEHLVPGGAGRILGLSSPVPFLLTFPNCAVFVV